MEKTCITNYFARQASQIKLNRGLHSIDVGGKLASTKYGLRDIAVRIQATPTYKYIPLIPVVMVLLIAVILVPVLGMEGLWISAAVALITGIIYVNRHGNEKKLHFDYQALDWLLYGDVHLLERLLNIAESENRRALVTYSTGFRDRVAGKALESLCKRRLIEVEVHCEKGARLDLSLTGPKGILLLKAKNEQDLQYRLNKLERRGWEIDEDQSSASGKYQRAMRLPLKPSKEDQMKKAAEGQAIIWFEDRTMATVRLTDGAMPSQGLPADKLPGKIEAVTIKKYPGTNLIASVRVKNFKPEYADEVRQVAEENGTVAWIKGEPRDIAAWLKGRHTLDGATIEDE